MLKPQASSRKPQAPPHVIGVNRREPAVKKTKMILRWGLVVAYALGIFLLSNSTSAKEYATATGIPDPISHGLLYLGLGILLYWALRGAIRAPFSALWAAVMVVLGTLYGASDELHQGLVGRDAEIGDLLSDVGGLVLAVVLILLGGLLTNNRGRNRR